MFRIRRARLALTAFAVLVAPLPAGAAGFAVLDGDAMVAARAGLEELYHARTAEAAEQFERVRELLPDSPAADFLLGGIEWHRLTTGPQGFVAGGELEAAFFARMDSAIALGEAALERDPADASARFFLGGAYGYEARYLAMQEKWWDAYRKGRKGVDQLETLVEEHPDCDDAYLGLGIYHYYADVIPSVLKVFSGLVGMNGDRARGLDELRRAVRGRGLGEVEARFFLSEIHTSFEEKHWIAYGYSRGLREQYPENELFTWLNARVLDELHLTDAAAAEWAELREVPRPGRMRGFLDYRLARSRLYGGDFEGAAADLGELIELGRLGSPRITAWGRLRCGVALDFLGRHEEALEQYRLAKELDSSDEVTERANARIAAARRDPSVVSLPELAEVARILRYTRGHDETTFRRVEDAVVSPSRGLSKSENDTYFAILSDLVIARLARGDVSHALDAVDRALGGSVRPERESRARLFGLRARALHRAGRDDEAERALGQAIGASAGDARDAWEREREELRRGIPDPAREPGDGAVEVTSPDRGEFRLAVEVLGGPTIPMTLTGDAWRASVPWPHDAAPLRYRFVAEDGEWRPDPSCDHVELVGDTAWSVLQPKQANSAPSE
ncbi:MAG: tetratricopeptide repeat protein [bacterium]